ncbi:MAG: glutamate-1-semialdehyde 2,1-aminomutase [Betaproteobacteria bacterium]|nr:MAG: glutamate-1-semialdehyde 2,1-aminomutase [Betaproteobacteria bacterium]
MKTETDQSLQQESLSDKAHRLIPGGCHTYAKGDDQFPSNAPRFLVRGKGCRVWDPDGREFIEYGMGLRAVTLGHAHPDVIAAAYAQMQLGNNFGRPAPIEVECAEALLEFLPRAQMVKFAKDGSTVNTAALKLARAYTGRPMVAICGDHPFFSYNDWFIGTTAMDGGILPEDKAFTLSFRYNDLDSLAALFAQHPDRIACVMLEAARTEEPRDNFLHRARELCHANGALFILDEMITGFRFDNGGAQEVYDIEPDLACFGKAMANGFSLSALVGRREIMELGGIRHPGKRVFLLSTTHGAEYPALAAAIETMKIYRREPVVARLYEAGDRLRRGVERVAAAHGVADHFKIHGRSCSMLFATLDGAGKPSQPFRTLFLQELIKGGVIAPSFIVSYSHDDASIDRTVDAVDRALRVYRAALEEGVERYLVGPSVKPVYRSHN